MEAIAPDALQVLKSSTVDEKKVILPPEELSRELYERVNEALVRIGGKWNKKARAHVFKDDPHLLFVQMLGSGQMPPKNPTAFFPTPEPLAVRMAALVPGTAKRILEPSAGRGNIAQAIRFAHPQALIECCEYLPRFQEILREQGFTVVGDNFLSFHPDYRYDAVVMNPPFTIDGDQFVYVSHILHAWDMVADNGILVAIAPDGVTFRQEASIKALRKLINRFGSYEKLGRETFKESETLVNTVLITLRKSPAVPEPAPEQKQEPKQTEVASAPASDEQDFRTKILSLTERLNQLDEDARRINEQINRNIAALFPSCPDASAPTLPDKLGVPMKKGEKVNDKQLSQMSLWNSTESA